MLQDDIEPLLPPPVSKQSSALEEGPETLNRAGRDSAGPKKKKKKGPDSQTNHYQHKALTEGTLVTELSLLRLRLMHPRLSSTTLTSGSYYIFRDC